MQEETTRRPVEPIMTLHECCEAMRANWISIGEMTLAAALVEGKLPFGLSISVNGSRKRVYLISRCQFYDWLKDFIGHDPIRVGER